jgi:hypothetical protein
MVRAPLDRSTGTLCAIPEFYDRTLRTDARDGPTAAAAERLAVYNRQYWFRLFGVLANAFPLTARLTGFWTFNGHASRFVLAHPPRGWNIDEVADGFEDFLGAPLDVPAQGGAGELPLIREAAIVDSAWRRVFAAPSVEPYRPTTADAARLLEARLAASPAVAVFAQHWPLLALRRGLVSAPSDTRIPAPRKLPHLEWWALVSTAAGIGQLPLAAREAELYGFLRRYPVGEALARLEAGCEPSERAALPEQARVWLARSVDLGFWSGLEDRSLERPRR